MWAPWVPEAVAVRSGEVAKTQQRRRSGSEFAARIGPREFERVVAAHFISPREVAEL